MGTVKVAHEPLLSPGRHVMCLADLRTLAVDAFPSSTSRPTLFSELERLVGHLVSQSLCCELWIDGSFLTEKPEPDDIDVSFSVFALDFDRLDATVQANLWTLLNGGKNFSPLLDTYICFRFLREDPRFIADGTDYWSEKWGKGWDGWLTGYAVIKLGESDVGLRLLS